MPKDTYFLTKGLSLPIPDFSTRMKQDFVKKQKDKARVSRKGKQKFKDLYGKRSIDFVIRESAASLKYMVIRYKKATTGETKIYKVAPYSFRYLRAKKTGRIRKALYAYDFKDKHIKAFYVMNIRSIQRTNSNFKPKWSVEISF